ncbi:MAG: NusB antitermination factor [Alphaproteobacteria bacterium]|jgi:N utilization substance protein B|nr:NusB antitermination factor [Alphaproteobacteria bacterium]
MSPEQIDAAAGRRRSAARMAAVQALYSIGQGGGSPKEVVGEFNDHRFATPDEAGTPIEPDREFFSSLVSGSSARRKEIDALLSSFLAKNWSLERIEKVVYAILQAGVFELLDRADVPAKVAINEYVDIAHAFYADGEPGFVNSVLDRIAREVRPEEFSAGARSR